MLPARVLQELHAALLTLGVSVQPAWIGAALKAEMEGGELAALKTFLESNNDASLPAPLLATCRESLLARVLFSSLEHIGARRLPVSASPEQHSMLRGLHVLQLVECVDVAHSLAELQEQPHRADRSWKMQLTDGTACVAAFERKKCSNLTPQVMQPGVKVREQKLTSQNRASRSLTLFSLALLPFFPQLALRDVPMRYGILMLEPGHIEVIGGSVPPPEDDDTDAVAAVEAHLRQQQEQESKQKEREEEKQIPPPQQQQQQQGRIVSAAAPGFPASAAAASSFSAGRPVAPASPAGAAAARGPFLPGSSAASSAALPPPYPFRSNVLPSSGAAASSSSVAAASASSLPLPHPSDDDEGEFGMIDEEGLAASWEAEEAERAAHQMPPPSGSPPAEKPLLTAADIMTPEPAVVPVIDDAAMAEGGDDDASVALLSQPSQPSLPPLSQSMPVLEMAPSILEMASPSIKPPAGAAAAAAEQTPTAASSNKASSASNAAMADVAATASNIPTLAPMSMLLTPPAAHAPSMMTDSPAATSASTVVQSPASAAPSSASSKGMMASSRTIPVLAASSGLSAKLESSSSGGDGSRAPSPASSTSSDDCIVLGEGGDSGGPHHRAARSKHIKSEAGAMAAPAAAASSSSPAADSTAPQSTLREQLQSRKAGGGGAAAPPAYVPAEVAPATLSRALDACAENKSRLFPPSHALHPFFASLPYTFVHLLRPLSESLPCDARPQHVLLEARVQAVVHAELSPEYKFRISLTDALSGTTVALAPGLVGKLIGCSSAVLAALPESTQDPFINRLEEALKLQLGQPPAAAAECTLLMQISVAPNSVAPDGGWVAGKEPVVFDLREITPEDRKQLDNRKAQMQGSKPERS